MVALRKSIHYVYDPATQRHTETWTGTSYANAVTDIQYGYNDLGELASVTVLKENGQTPAAVQSSTQYNAAGGKSTTTLPNTVYTYDAGGRLTSTFNSATGITTSYTYKPNTNDISQETVSASSGASVATYSYSYRADGLKTGEVDTTYNSDGTVNDTRTLSWQYDGLDRVTQETSSDTAGTTALNYTDLYQYDLNSNRTTETIENGSGTVTDTITSSYNANDELTQAVDANTGTTVYTYDNNGSQIETQHTPSGGTSPDTTTTNEYDLQGQMAGTQTTNSTGTTKATYQYDDSGNRIVETNTNTAGTTTTMYYLVDTQNPNGYPQPIEQAATPGSPQITYVWGKTLISQTYATGATIPGVGTATSPTTYYILTDAHGSTRLITNATGGVIENMNYDAFGNALGFNASTALTSYLYSSMSFDAASGNYYDHARFYNAGIGMFDQADYGYSGSLTDPMTDLPYTFTGGDPINMLDLNGHDFSLTDALASFAINSIMTSAISDVVAPFASDAAALLIPPSLLIALETAGAPDAVEIGIDGSVGSQYRGFGGFVAGGMGLLWSAHTGNAALYAVGGGGLSFFGGGNGFSGGIGASVGLVWRTPRSSEFAASKWQISLPLGALPDAFRAKVERDLVKSTASSNFLTDAEAKLMMSAGWSSSMVDDYQWQVMKDAFARTDWLVSRLDSLSVNIFGSAGNFGQDIGVSFSLDIASGATAGFTGGFSVSRTWALQIAPGQSVYFG